jgi:predicted  nucleic acid-binding Zn-ribbon protein
MLEAIDKLLVLQESDRKLLAATAELEQIAPRRLLLLNRAKSSQSGLEAAKTSSQKIESERKRLELEVDSKKQQIEKYSLQQFQTKKNEEYKALAHEIDTCKAAISKLEDQQLDLMEQAETVAKEVAKANQLAKELKAAADTQIAELDKIEAELKQRIADLQAERASLCATVDEEALNRYERLLKTKGNKVVVGIDHGVCGGCHMKFSKQTVLSCRAGDEIVTCPNCGRILYYSPEMSLVVTE